MGHYASIQVAGNAVLPGLRSGGCAADLAVPHMKRTVPRDVFHGAVLIGGPARWPGALLVAGDTGTGASALCEVAGPGREREAYGGGRGFPGGAAGGRDVL